MPLSAARTRRYPVRERSRGRSAWLLAPLLGVAGLGGCLGMTGSGDRLDLRPGGAANAAVCPAPGEWRSGKGDAIDPSSLYRELAKAQVVLLGEQHDRLEHHRWQLHTLAALHALRPDLVIGLEMLPREAQEALDAWVAGEIDEAQFLAQSRWHEAWGFDPQLYLPILHFARMNRIPVFAINLERSLVTRIAREGWEAVPAEERYGIPPPVGLTKSYEDYLKTVLLGHPTGGEDGDLERFVAAQLVWDRAMAAGLADAARDGRLAVGLVGSGHLGRDRGVPHQLRDLGITESRSLMPLDDDGTCASAGRLAVADAVYGVAPGQRYEPPKPMLLGVRIETVAEGVAVRHVGSDSVAEQAGILVGDTLTQAAGVVLTDAGTLVAIIRRQSPGSVLPLTVLRDGKQIEVLARFPALPQ